VAKCVRRCCYVFLTWGVISAPAAWPLDVLRMGSFPIGGRVVSLHDLPVREVPVSGANFTMKVDPNGDYLVDQMYVQYVKLRHPRAKYPLILIHGGGMTASTWEDTPDGRPGWQTYFLYQGHDVYMVDSVGRGRAGVAPPQIQSADPIYPTAEGTWLLARMGPQGSYNSDPARRVGYPGVKFPLAAFDTLMRERVPSRGSADAAATGKALALLIQRICPCVLIAHSSGGPYALHAALGAPDKVKAVVLLEPAGAPDARQDAPATVKGVPHLFLWGDFLTNDPIQGKAMPPVKAWSDALASAGGESDWVELPKLGITGNTHVMMMDANSDAVAGVVQTWFVKHKLMK
jgi:pimeloyl-ACP methyl ester carboxylesterase